ncbi:MAG: hypothetical protein STSR0009_12840 [Methanoregula sp.]
MTASPGIAVSKAKECPMLSTEVCWGFRFHLEHRGWTLAPDAHFPPSAIDGLEGVGILVKCGKMGVVFPKKSV